MFLSVTSKLIFWIVFIIGVLPAITVVSASLYAVKLHKPDSSASTTSLEKLAKERQNVYKDHALLKFGPLGIKFFPRYWPAVTAAIGAILLFSSLLILLHLPISPKP